jgi:DNA polymerase-3 subunit epsilon
MSWHEKRLIGFDIETTGLDMDKDQIISAAIVLVGDNKLQENYDFLIKPTIEVPDEAIKLHGISREEISTGKEPAEGIKEINQILAQEMNSGATLVIFNSNFDLTILLRQSKELGLAPLTELVSKENFIIVDPLVIDRASNSKRPGRRNLQTLCRHYHAKFDFNNAHTADADAIAAARLAWRMADIYPELQIDREVLFNKQAGSALKQAKELRQHFESQGRKTFVSLDWPYRKDVVEKASLISALS